MLESLLNLPDKSLWDVGEIFLAANKIIGSRETHRIVIRINKEIASPGDHRIPRCNYFEMAKKLESKFWQEVKQNTPGISWTRLESWASAGVPDLLGYNKKGHFFHC